MKIGSKIALMVAVVSLLFLVGWTSKAERPAKTDWEYKTVTIWHNPDVPYHNVKELNDVGDEGWEMVAVITEDVTRTHGRQTNLTYYFKRPK